MRLRTSRGLLSIIECTIDCTDEMWCLEAVGWCQGFPISNVGEVVIASALLSLVQYYTEGRKIGKSYVVCRLVDCSPEVYDRQAIAHKTNSDIGQTGDEQSKQERLIHGYRMSYTNESLGR